MQTHADVRTEVKPILNPLEGLKNLSPYQVVVKTYVKIYMKVYSKIYLHIKAHTSFCQCFKIKCACYQFKMTDQNITSPLYRYNFTRVSSQEMPCILTLYNCLDIHSMTPLIPEQTATLFSRCRSHRKIL